jgi:hypothetical protein
MAGEYDVDTPALQVNVYRDGQLVAQVPCESVDDATDVVAQWEDQEGVECEVEDLAERHGAQDVLQPEPEDTLPESEYR